MFTETVSLWKYLKSADKPIIMYGMGNGADKILEVLNSKGIGPAAFIASDEFVRGHSFRGFEVKKLDEIKKTYNDFIILISFGTNIPDVLEKIYELSEKYEVYAPDVPVCGDVLSGLCDEKFIVENINTIVEVRELFEDEQSKEIFDQLFNYKISGRLAPLKATVTDREEAFDLLELKKDKTEVYFDFGAYDGDTVQEFMELTGGQFDKIYAFEPDFRNFCKLKRRLYMLPPDKLEAVNAAVSNKDGEESFKEAAGRQSALSSGGKSRKAQVIKADTFCERKKIKPTFMKYDVEGSEKDALNGSANILKKHKPRLAVSLYHRNEDILEIPILIKKLNNKYKLYLRRHEYIPAWDINLYCL